MKTLQIDKEKAKRLFKNASEEIKQIFIDTFGQDAFTGNIMDRVKTFEDACAEAGVKPEDVYDQKDTPDEKAYKILKLITKVLNEDWTPNWKDTDQRKWYPWFEFSSGSGFDYSGTGCHYTYTGTLVGSRLCFKSDELAEYAGKKFIKIYNDFLI